MQLAKIKICLNPRFTVGMFLILLVSCACRKSNNQVSSLEKTKEQYVYNLTQPTKVYDVSKALKEISGISFLNENTLATVQDEKGTIYHYSLLKEEIIEKVKFKDSGDFEDVAVVGSATYAIRSNGKLYKVYEGKDGKTHEDKFDLKVLDKSDAEGLAYDQINNRLLIACKGKIAKMQKDERCVYAFDLQDKEISEKPIFVIKNQMIRNFVKKNKIDLSKSLRNELFKEGAVFHPSSISVHPVSRDIYLLSSINKLFVVLDGKKLSIKEFKALNKKIFEQPEGMCFDSMGNLYISNEAGSEDSGTILKFDYKIMRK